MQHHAGLAGQGAHVVITYVRGAEEAAKVVASLPGSYSSRWALRYSHLASMSVCFNSVETLNFAPPASRIGPLTDAERQDELARSPLRHRYDAALDRESAYEVLRARAEREALQTTERQPPPARRRSAADPLDTLLNSAARTVGNRLGRELVRGLLGSLRGSRRR